MSDSFLAAPTLVRSKVARIVLPALIVVVAIMVLGSMVGAIVDNKLHLMVVISAVAAVGAGLYHERLVTLAQQPED